MPDNSRDVDVGGKALRRNRRNDEMTQRLAAAGSLDNASSTDTPLCWLLLGFDAITAELAPPPPNLAAEMALIPSPPPNIPKPAVQAIKCRKARSAKAMGSTVATPLPPQGTPENIAARLLLCLRRVAQWQQRARSQRQLHELVRQRRGSELPLQMMKPAPCNQDVQKVVRPCTPDVLEKVKERDTFWQPMHSQVWRRRELKRQKPQRTHSTPSLTRPRASQTRASRETLGSMSHTSLPPVKMKDAVKKYERGAPALGAGFKVLAGFRTQPGFSPPVGASSDSQLLTLDGAVDLLKDWGVWPAKSPTPEQISLPRSMGSLPPLRDSAQKLAPTSDGFQTRYPGQVAQTSTELGQVSTHLEEASAELMTTLGPDELDIFDYGDDDDVYQSSCNVTCKSLPVPQINPLTVFPELKNRAPMPVKRIFFADPNSDDTRVNSIRFPLDIQEIQPPPPAETPSTVESITDYSLLMASVMRGDLLSSSLRKPRETAAELKATLELASSGLVEALDEPDSDEEKYKGKRHPPPWTRKKAVLHSSGVRDFADLGPNRQPQYENDTDVVADQPQWAYMNSCAKEMILPKAHRPIVKAIAAKARRENRDDNSEGDVADTSRDAVQLNLADHSLGDSGLHAVGQTLAMLGSIEMLNLSGNKLSSKATSGFLVSQIEHFGKMVEFDLSRNPSLGEETFRTVIQCLHDGKFRRLQSIHLSGIDIPEKVIAPLMKELLENVVLKSLSLADAKLGFKNQDVFQAMVPLIVTGALSSLDISGNFIRREGAETLARALEKTRTLHALDLSYNVGDHYGLPDKMLVPRCTTEDEEEEEENDDHAQDHLVGDIPFSPILTILESLQWNMSLRKLSLVNCSLDFAADFVIAEILMRHSALAEVDLSSNPHGLHGLACLLRALSIAHSAMCLLRVSELRDETISLFACKYDFKDPSGKYTLNLKHPQHRSVLRTLLDRPNQGSKDSKACFREVSFQAGTSGGGSFGGVGSIQQDMESGIHKVPTDGVLRFSYGVPMPTTPRGDSHPLAKVQRCHRQGLVHVGFERSMVLASAYQTCTSEHQKLLFTEALCQHVLLKSSQVDLFLQCSPKTLNLQTLQRLAPNVIDCSELLELSMLLKNPGERLKARADLRALAFLQLRNPTGRYSLQLENLCDRACAARLQVLAAFEATLYKNQGRPDISQRGNLEPIRNARHDGHDFLRGENARGFSTVSLPPSGLLKLDYTTLARARKGLKPITEETLERLLAAIRHTKATRADTLNAFRGIADRFGTTSSDIKVIIKTFASLVEVQDFSKMRHTARQTASKPPRMWMRVEALLACFGCYTNKAEIASKLMRDRELFTSEDCSKLRSRLGPVFVFDWKRCDDDTSNRPTGCSYSFDLAMNDERLIAKFILSAAKEETWESLETPELTQENIVEKLPDRPPEKLAEWVNPWLHGEFPEEGIFSVDFVKVDGVETSKSRREIAQKLGFEVTS